MFLADQMSFEQIKRKERQQTSTQDIERLLETMRMTIWNESLTTEKQK